MSYLITVPLIASIAITDGADVALAAIIFGTVTGALISMARMWFRRLELRDRGRAMPANVEDRLLRIEQAVDAIAIEVERMSESQRFTTKILVERLPAALSSESLRSGDT